ncbi:MAG: hypothetical protein AAF999_15635 [Pseudomonadota bacterium]
MHNLHKPQPEDPKTSGKPSPVGAVIAWLIEADREYRVAQSIIDDTRNTP